MQQFTLFFTIFLITNAVTSQNAPDFCNSILQVDKIFTVFHRVYITVDNQLFNPQTPNTYTWFMVNNSFKPSTDLLSDLFRPLTGQPDSDYDAVLTPNNQPHRCRDANLTLTDWPQQVEVLHRNSVNDNYCINYTITNLDGQHNPVPVGSAPARNSSNWPSVTLREGRYHGALVDPVSCNRYFIITFVHQQTGQSETKFLYTQRPDDYSDLQLKMNVWQEAHLNQLIRHADYIHQFDAIFSAYYRVFAWHRHRPFLYEYQRAVHKFQPTRVTVRDLFCGVFNWTEEVVQTTTPVDDSDEWIWRRRGFNWRWMIVVSYAGIDVLVLINSVLFLVWMSQKDDD